jgi:hypothetical protein
MKVKELNGEFVATLNIYVDGDPVGIGRTYDNAVSNLFGEIKRSKTFRAIGQEEIDWLAESDLYAEYLYENCQGWIPMGNEEGVMSAMENGEFFDDFMDDFYVEEAL